MLQIKKYSPTNHKLKTLIYGLPKSGKTTFAGTAPRPLFVCSELGLLSVKDKSPDYVEVKTLQDLKDLVKQLQTTLPDYDTIVIDSLSEIAKIIKDNLTNNGSKAMVLRDRGTFSEEIMQAVRQIIMLPYHIVCIVHSQETSNDAGQVEFYDLAIQGKAKNEIPRYFDIIGFSSIDADGTYKISVAGNNKTLCGDRSNTINKENVSLNIQDWIDGIVKISTNEPQIIVKEIESTQTAPTIELVGGVEEQVQKIDKAIIDSVNVEATKGTLRLKIASATNLTEDQKRSLLTYIDTK